MVISARSKFYLYSAVEPELFPCLRKFGISFYEYNPRT